MSLVDINHNMPKDADMKMELQMSTGIEELKQQTSNFPYDYNSHIALITACREAEAYNDLSEAYKNMSFNFPLTEKLWLQWIEDFKKFSSNDTEGLDSLFEKAIKDYICPDIWFEYMQHSISWVSQENGVDKIRKVMERGLTACGLHVTKGTQLWETYREFENVIATTLQPKPGSVATEEQQEAMKKQTDRIHALFRRQLVVPLYNMEETMEEYEEWLGEEECSETLEDAHDNAIDKLEKLKEFEEVLLNENESDHLQTYEAYLDLEISDGDPARIQCLFERSIADNCLNSDLWLKYTKYLDTHLKGSPAILDVYARSVRNCPWVSKLWTNYMIALEADESKRDVLKDVLTKALKSGFSSLSEKVDIWKLACDQARRRLRNCKNPADEDLLKEELRSVYKEATSYTSKVSKENKKETDDSYMRLWIDWAYDEASCLSDLSKASDILESVIRDDPKVRRNPLMWVEFFQLENEFGKDNKIEKCRGILRRGVQRSAIDTSECTLVCKTLSLFERRFGTLDDIAESERRISDKMEQINRRREKQKAAEQSNSSRKKTTTKRGSTDDGPMIENKRSKYNEGQKSKKQPPANQGNSNKNNHAKKESPHKSNTKSPISKKSTENKKSVPAPPPGFKINQNKPTEPEIKKGLKPENLTEKEEKCTVFVSNLDFNIENVGEKLNEFFQQVGTVKDVRIITDYKGKFRGYVYIQFDNERSAKKALEIDRSNFEGRPMFISPYVDKSKNPTAKVFKFQNKMEDHKLFVKNLPISLTEEETRGYFGAFGIIKALRIATNRSGESKGIAYIEYEDSKSAKEAVLKMDGKKIQDNEIFVAISNPPPRKPPQGDSSSRKHFDNTPIGGRSHSRTQISFMPRSLNRSSQVSTKNGSIEKKDFKPMSNKDFASLLLKK